MAQSKFKTGDRVHWKGNEYIPEDYGTVQPDYCEVLDAHPTSGCVLVLWDSDGKIQQISEDKIDYEQPSNQGIEFTVQNCIDFLIARGYSVTLGK